MSSLENWRAPFKRPNKISGSGKIVHISADLSEEEYLFVCQLAEGYGMMALARGFQCDVATIHRTLRRVATKMQKDTCSKGI